LYHYNVYTGGYPDITWHVASFEFEKTDTGVGVAQNGWENIGESFDDTADKGLRTNGHQLLTNYPNPFNPTTSLQYSIPAGGFVSLKVFDVLGREVAKLVDGYRDSGIHHVGWDASGMASGVYIYTLTAGDFNANGKVVLLK
ncbi:T9SS type A sorting domain-containing protein, partial [bacterium]|nr:T9SS type A sorting domain-containing protein [bacterium]